jgi:outer membrane protein OmpA-like peptidoglycan-associated protein
MVALRVLEPCGESWSAMQGGSRVRHCEACDKDVHDLTQISELEAVAYLRFRGGASMCVRMLAVGAAIAACGGPAQDSRIGSRPPVATANLASDRDRADLPEGDDSCPDEPEDKKAVDDGDGCPEVDADGDGIADAQDACPKEPGTPSADPKKNGCPAFVGVTSMGLVIVPQILFPRAGTTLLRESLPIVDEAVEALKHATYLEHLEVAGHASSDERSAQRVSEQRARAVLERMVAGGIERKRLVARGYGASKPLKDNDTAEGLARNRRVEFRVLDAAKGAQADACPVPTPPAKP